jgi:hypothetical protein
MEDLLKNEEVLQSSFRRTIEKFKTKKSGNAIEQALSFATSLALNIIRDGQ